MALAYEIARRYNIEVKAAPGTIFLLDTPDGERNYYIVDTHGTKWNNVKIDKLRKRKRRKLIEYIKSHHIPRNEEWRYFRKEW